MQKQKVSGFNLIELIIAVAIVGVLAAVAYPSYMDHVRAAKLEGARQALADLAKALDRRYTHQIPNTYGGNASGGSDTGTPDSSFFQATAPLDSNNPSYNLRIDSADTTGYTVRAEAIAGANVDPNCTPITLSSNGTRTPADCW